MSKPVGGRGKKAPYETTHVRVPLPVKDRVEELVEQFKSGSLDDADRLTVEECHLADEYRNLLTSNSSSNSSTDNSLTSLEDTLEIVREILRQKKSARESIARLLTSLYNVEIKAKDL